MLFNLGTKKLVELLKSPNKDSFSPLHWAVGRNTRHQHNIYQTVDYLALFGKERLNVLNLQLPTRQTFPSYIDQDEVTTLQQHIDQVGDTIAHTIARRGCDRQLFYMLLNLVDAEITNVLSLKNCVNETPLHVAANHSDRFPDVLSLFIDESIESSHIDNARHLELLKMQNILGDTVFHKLASSCVQPSIHGNVFEYFSALDLDSLLSIRNKRLETAEHAAVRHGNIWYVESVFNKLKQLPNRIRTHLLMKDSTGSTPLHTAVYHVDDKLLSYLLSEVDEDATKALLETTDNDGNTPAHLALELNKIDKLNLLLKLSSMRGHPSTLLAENEEGRNVLDLIGDKLNIWKRLIEDILGKSLVIRCACTLPRTVW